MIFDVIVIGSGPGGASSACIFSEGGLSVLLIEEGKNIPQSKLSSFSTDEMNEKYRNQGVTVAFGNPKINFIEGKVLGGGSEVNSGLYFPPNEKIMDSWKDEFNILDFNYEDLIKHSKIIEKDINVSYMPKNPPLASLKLKYGAEKLNWSSIEVPRWFSYDSEEGNSGIRQSMSETYIPRYINSGGKIETECKAKKVLKRKNFWEVLCFSKNKNINFKAKNIFICGGTIQTPILLKKSGIRKNIGKIFKLHPTIKVLAKFPEKVNFDNLGVPVHQVKEFFPSYSFGCSISSKEYIAAGLIDYPQDLLNLNETWDHFASYYGMISSGKGKIRKLPFGLGEFVTYKLSNQDMLLISKALKNLCKLLFSAGAEKLYPSVSFIDALSSNDDIDEIPNFLKRKDVSLMTIHIMASCPMGENKSKCAVDSYGQVHNHKGLYINDSSILCDGLGYNPQGTTMAIVRRNALEFLRTFKNVQ